MRLTERRDGTVRTASITTLGCKANRYDSTAMEEALREAQIEIVGFPAIADAYIINTCTVTARANAESRRLIRRVRRLNPLSVVIVTGCYAEVSGAEVAAIDGVDWAVTNSRKGDIIECLRRGRREGPAVFGADDAVTGTPLTLRARGASGRARSVIKVQEGCDRSCAYCIIPRARGQARSVPLAAVSAEIDALVNASYKEIVLTGIHLGGYGADLGYKNGLTALVENIESSKSYGGCRFRLSSLDPDELDDELIGLLSNGGRVCNHVHIALQSGDDDILKAMRRTYSSVTFAERVRKIVASVEGVSIGVDVIAGFPGESEREFENTYSLIEGLPISYMHIFPYSRRAGTLAAAMRVHPGRDVVKERCSRLSALDAVKRGAFHKRFEGGNVSVLFDMARDKKSGLLRGRARNYIRVYADGPDELKGALVDVSLGAAFRDGMSGRVV